MSRRNHHGGRHHGRPHKPAERRPAAPSTLAPGGAPQSVESSVDGAAMEPAFEPMAEVQLMPRAELTPEQEPLAVATAAPEPDVSERAEPPQAFRPDPVEPAEAEVPQLTNGEAHHHATLDGNGDAGPGTCTAPQLRRFIKSRAYVPMHELRRRFAINGFEDDVTQVDVNAHRIYIGLPEREGRMLGELLRGGDVGFELSLDPITPIVVGVYPMRPVPRP